MAGWAWSSDWDSHQDEDVDVSNYKVNKLLNNIEVMHCTQVGTFVKGLPDPPDRLL